MPVKGKHLLHLVPHGINSDEFKPLPKGDSSVEKLKKSLLGEGEYNFIVAFNSRNAHRKHPANLILAFKSFCASIDQEQAKKCALIMHTDKVCEAGTDLVATIQAVCPEYKVVLDESRRSPEEMVAFYNLADVTANVSSNEGFGLSIAESIMCGTPVIVNVTGGLQDQIGQVDDEGKSLEFDLNFGTNSTGKYRNHGVWAKPIWPCVKTIQGSVPTPYIFDDVCTWEESAEAIMYWYLMTPDQREKCGLEGRRWAMNEGGINAKNMCDQFIKAMDYTINNFIPEKGFDLFTLNDHVGNYQPHNSIGLEIPKIDIDKLKNDINTTVAKL